MKRTRTTRRAPLVAIAASVAFASVAIMPTSNAADTPSGGHSQSSHVDRPGVVQYWGYTPGSGEWKSKATTSSARANHSPAEFAQANPALTQPAAASAAGPGFVCSLFVSDVYRSGSRIQSDTWAQCSGSFDVQYTGAQFKRDSWLGWRNFSGVMTTPWTTGYTQDWTWWRSCTSGGTYNYRLVGLQHTQAYDGTWHTGPNVYSADNFRTNCGS